MAGKHQGKRILPRLLSGADEGGKRIKMITLEDLDHTVSQINQLAKELKERLYPNGKPDWMSQENWDNISNKEDDCPLKLDRIHCQNCFFISEDKCEYPRNIAEGERING